LDGSTYNKEAGSRLIIGCEGNFGSANASLTLYNMETKTVSNNLFNTQNNLPLGDVLQSSSLFNGDLYVVINNSSKVEVIDTSSFLSKGTITGLPSPRYFLGVSSTKGYVTDLYSNAINIVNLNTFQITGSIPTSGWTEQLLLHNNKVYVTQKGTNQLLIIDPNLDVVSDSITVGREPNSLVVDAFQNLWVLCSGGVNEAQPELVKVNTASNSVTSILSFNSIADSPNSLRIDTSGTTLFYLNNDVFKHSISETSIGSTPFISSGNSIYYGLGVNPFNNEIYLADAIDYVQPGKVSRFKASSSLIDEFSVGLIPQDFTFLEN
jgi:YVTN family beta-propeller protein